MRLSPTCADRLRTPAARAASVGRGLWSGCDSNSTAVGLAHEAAAVAGRMGGPAAGDAPAEDRRAQHGAFQSGAAVDVAAGHARHLAGSVESRDRLEVLVEHAALQVGLDAAEVLARQREDLHGVI